MAKNKIYYVCTNCDNELTQKWGQCPKCKMYGSIEERQKIDSEASTSGYKSTGALKPTKKALTISELSQRPLTRTSSGIGELDRVLGGGFVDGEVVLLAASPGAGKSSLAITIANNFGEKGLKVLYASGEESEQQIGLRAKRFGISNSNIRIVNETNLETILGHIDEEKPKLVIIDSLQTVASKDVIGSMGSITQGKEAAITLTKIAKTQNIMMLLINQVTKE